MRRQTVKIIYSVTLAGLLTACASSPDAAAPQQNAAQSGYLGDPSYQQAPNRRDWDNGYYVDATGRFVPLAGRNPDSLGEGGGRPQIWYKTK